MLSLGATVHRLVVTGGDGVRRNVVLGHADAAERLGSGDYIGGTIGRYANRIAAGRFELEGREVVVGTHDRGNSLHGGPDGFDRRLWDVVSHERDEVVLALASPDGDQGFPGTVTARVTYRVIGQAVQVVMEATTDAVTVVNLTNHAYLNLDGEGAGTIDDHVLTVPADDYTRSTPPASRSAATLRSRARRSTSVRRRHRWGAAPGASAGGGRARDRPQLCRPRRGTPDGRRPRVPAHGTRLELHSDQPGLQVYTGNFLDGTRRSTGGGRYRQGDGIALEPQLFPAPQPARVALGVLRPGETYSAEPGVAPRDDLTRAA